MRQLSNLGLALLLLILLAGCGQKGPLYLPGDEEAAATYDPGNEYADEDEKAGENDGEGDNAQGDNGDNDAQSIPATSDGEG